MDNLKQATRKMRGGMLTAIIVSLLTMLTVGIGVALGAEGGIEGIINDAVGGIAKVGETLLQTKGGDSKGGDGKEGEDKNYDGFTVYKLWDDGPNAETDPSLGNEHGPVRLTLYRDQMDPISGGRMGYEELVDSLYLDEYTGRNAATEEFDDLTGRYYRVAEGFETAKSEDGQTYPKACKHMGDVWKGSFNGTYPAVDGGSGNTYIYYVVEEGGRLDYVTTYYMNETEGAFYVVNTLAHVNVGKVDSTTGAYIAGAELEISGVHQWTSGTYPETIWGLQTGQTYAVQETMTPVGYTGSVLTYFRLNEDGTVEAAYGGVLSTRTELIDIGNAMVTEDVVLIENDPISPATLYFAKQGFNQGGSLLGGARYQVLDQNENVVWDSINFPEQEAEGFYTVPNLSLSRNSTTVNYTLHEVTPPTGYDAASDIVFCFGPAGELSVNTSLTVGNKWYVEYSPPYWMFQGRNNESPVLIVFDELTPPAPTTSTLYFAKTDVNTGNLLPGATFQVLDDQYTPVWTSGASESAEGFFSVSGLETGRMYTLRETVPPTGYDYAMDELFTFDLSGALTTRANLVESGPLVERSGGDPVLVVADSPLPTPTGSLTVSKEVSGDGADQSQQFPFTVTFTGTIDDGTYGGINVQNNVATFNLAHGGSVTLTDLPAGITYEVSEGAVDNYTPSWTNSTGTIPDGGVATASCLNTYAAPLITPETALITVNRIDDNDGIDSTSMMLTETLPVGMSAESVDTSGLTMTVESPEETYAPTVDPITNALVYNFSMSNGQTMRVNLIVGSQVSVVNSTASVNLEKKAGDGEATGQTFSVGTAEASTPLSLTVGASLNSSDPSDPSSQTGTRPKGWIQVNKVINDGATYDAFKVFDADVVQDGAEYKGTHLSWANASVEQAVRSFLSSYDEDGTTGSDYDAWLASKYGTTVTFAMRDNPQNAAEFIAIMIANSDEDTTANTTPKTTKGDTFATRLASVLRNYGIQPDVVIPANTPTQADQGYYVVATTTSTIGNGEAGTAPIWAPVPQTGYTVDEKASVPQFNKQVKDNTDDTTNFNKVADASTGQWLDFKLTTTLPQNLSAYPAYEVSILDQIPSGMEATISTDNGFSVSLAGEDITSKVEAGLSDNNLTIYIQNVLDATTLGVTADGNDTLIVNYRAKLTEDSVKGAAGNNNTATLTYSADPLVSATKGTLESSARVLTYQLKVDKVDEATRLNVDGAKFAAKTTVGGTDYWVKSNGSLTTDENERGIWTTTNGALTISGIDEGTYTLTEVEAPNLYERIAAPLVVQIDAVKDYASGTLTSLGAQASGANGTLVSNPSATQDGYVGSVLETGLVEVRISDVKQIVLPITGMPVKTAGIIAGVLIAIASIATFIVNRRRNGEEENEE